MYQLEINHVDEKDCIFDSIRFVCIILFDT